MSTVIILEIGKNPSIKHEKFVINKTTKQIESDLMLKDNQILGIKCPTYIQPLQKDIIPTQVYPQLLKKVENFDPSTSSNMSYVFQILDKSEKQKFYLLFNVETENGIEMPQFKCEIDIKSFSNMNNFINYVVKKFGMEISNPQIIIGEKPIDKNINFKDFLDLTKESKELKFKCLLQENALKTIRMRTQIIKELKDTEKTYLNNLNIILKYYKESIQKAKLLKDEELSLIFDPIPKMIECHEDFLSKIDQYQIEYKAELSKIFIYFSTLFRTSEQYIADYNKINEIATSITNDQKMKEIVQNNPISSGLDFCSLLIIPIQRFPRYVLFIRELAKFTPPSHPDSETIHFAQEIIESLTHEMEFASETIKKRKNVLEIQSRLNQKIQLVTENRKLKKEYVINIINPKKGKGTFYLFNDSFLITYGIDKEKIVLFSFCNNCSFCSNACSGNGITFQVEKECVTIEFKTIKIKENVLFKFYKAKKQPNITFNEDLIISNELSNPLTPPEIADLGSTIIGNIVYFAGGNINGKNSNTPLIIYDSSKKSLSVEKVIEAKWNYSKIVQINSELYLVGGKGSPYKLINDKWIKMVSNSNDFIREGFSLVTYQNKIIVFGGKQKQKKLMNTVLIFDLNLLKWFSVNESIAPEPRQLHSACIFKESMYVFGGIGKNSNVFDDLWSFSFQTKSWERIELKGEIFPRYGHVSVIINNYLILIGGENNTDIYPPIILINLFTYKSNVIKVKGNLPMGIIRGTATYIQKTGEVIYFGGFNNHTNIYFNSFYLLKLPNYILNSIPNKLYAFPIPLANFRRCTSSMNGSIQQTKEDENKPKIITRKRANRIAVRDYLSVNLNEILASSQINESSVKCDSHKTSPPEQ